LNPAIFFLLCGIINFHSLLQGKKFQFIASLSLGVDPGCKTPPPFECPSSFPTSMVTQLCFNDEILLRGDFLSKHPGPLNLRAGTHLPMGDDFLKAKKQF
jgi:hypothetical protein